MTYRDATMKRNHLNKSLSAAIITLLIGSSALADDTEIFFGSTSASTGAPNILLVLDTSGSMDNLVTSTIAYDPAETYTGNCSSSTVYFKNSATSTLPTCGSGGIVSNARTDTSVSGSLRGSVALSDFNCSPATISGGNFATAGYISVAAIRWRSTSTQVTTSTGGNSTTVTYAWSNNLNPEDTTSSRARRGVTTTTVTTHTIGDVACRTHDYAGSYPNDSSPTASTQWTSNSSNSYWDGGTETTYTFYSAHYLNWYHNFRTSTSQSRMQIVKAAATSLLDSLSGVNVGLMRYDAYGNGGMVLAPLQDVATGRSAMQAEIASWRPAGNTPLSETLAEAERYYTGKAVSYGNNSYKYNCSTVDSYGNCSSGGTYASTPSVGPSRVGGSLAASNYQSPMNQSCQKNHIVFLTDGEPTYDDGANTYINGLNTADASCSGSGGCLSTLTSYMYNNDVIANTTLPDEQNITTHFIGFGSDVSGGAPFTYLTTAARAGGGDAYSATDLDSLTETLNEIVLGVLDQSTTFTSPSVAVNAFNKTQVLEDLYVSVFEPSELYHWPGNIKKYKLRNSMIVGQNTSVSAVNTSTGFFEDTSQSFWSSVVDGSETTVGGAANMIPIPANRHVYTYIGADPTVGSWINLTSNVNYSVEDGNTTLTDSLLGIGNTGDPARTTLLSWVRGADTQDEDGDSNRTEARHVMGDPVHSQPAVVIYGNTGSTTTARLNDALVFVATNDGYLHAIDVSTGEEQWSFIPQELLSELRLLYTNPTSGDTKHYSLDGNLRVLKYDVDNDGVVDTADGDRVFLYFSMGRGGPNYYALDVTDKTQPKYMWTLDSSELGGIVTESWSTPALGRVRIASATQNPQRLVLIFGGGYDPAEYGVSYNSSGNNYGKGIFMVDAVRGSVLWNQTRTSNGSAFDKMTHAIPSNIGVLDTNGDGWTDRLYVGDMAGQLWRLDVTSGNTASSLVAGGVIASLGAKVGTASDATNRSFYSEPDIAKVIQTGAANYYNIAIGSGDRDRPKSNTSTWDRFYGIRDYNLSAMDQDTFDALTVITDSDLTLVDGTSTTIIGTNGWKFQLDVTQAEKVLAQSITVDGVVMFTTYIPNNGGLSTSCTPSTGTGRTYSMYITSGIGRFSDLFETFDTTGLPSQITIVNEADIIRTDGTSSSSSSTSSGSSSSSSGTGSTSLCLSGVTVQGNCVNFGAKIRTFWREAGAE